MWYKFMDTLDSTEYYIIREEEKFCSCCSKIHTIPTVMVMEISYDDKGKPFFYDAVHYYCEEKDMFYDNKDFIDLNRTAINKQKNVSINSEYPDATKGDIYLNPFFGDLWVVDIIDKQKSFIKINDGYSIDIDEPEGFVKVGHIDGVINVIGNNDKEKSNDVKTFEDIMKRYKNGEFGDKPLSMYEILEKAGQDELLEKMSYSDLHYLKNKASNGFTKMLFKLLEEKIDKGENK